MGKILWQFTVAIKSDPVASVALGSGPIVFTVKHIRKGLTLFDQKYSR